MSAGSARLGKIRAGGIIAAGEGSRLRADGSIVARNSFVGQAIHRVDFRVSKTFPLAGRVKIEGFADSFNLFNHENYNAFVTNEAARNYGAPSFDSNIAFQPRTAQFGFRVTF